MNNPLIYDVEQAGGVPYPHTNKYYYEKWFTTMGLTDGAEYKSIRFNIRNDSKLLHWANSYLELNGQLVKKDDGTAYAAGDPITLIHNAIPHMFSNVKLTIGNQMIENINQVGHVSSMMYDVLYPRSKAKTEGLQFVWYPDTANSAVPADNKGFAIRQKYIIDTPHTKGKFKLRIPMRMLFGFMENFVVLKGYPVEIDMVRGPDHPALYRAAGTGEGKLKFSEITLNVPVVEPSTAVALEYMKGLQSRTGFLYSFRERHGMFAPVPVGIQNLQQPITSTYFTEKPLMIWVGFQRDYKADQTSNYAIYTNEDVESAYIQMNNTQFPQLQFKANWTENNNGFFFEMQRHVRENYLQLNDSYAEGNMLTPVNFKDLFTIYCFDVSKQEMTLGSNNVTCDLHVHFKAPTAVNLRVYIGWFNDRTLEMFTDGSPINIRTQVDNYK